MLPVKKLLAAGVLAASGSAAHAGIPVIDVTAIMNMVQQILHQLTMIENQVAQIEQARAMLQNMSGSRMLGTLLRDPALNNYVPLNAPVQLDTVVLNGYGGLTAPARVLRDADMVWNCDGMAEPYRTQCQAVLGQPYQNKALLRQAITMAAQRIGQINGLLTAINGTTDQASKLEIGARIQGEQALLQHEATRAQLLALDMTNEARREEVRRLERTADMLTRPADVRAFLGGAAP
jgi:type IV secretion system protein VirB5